MTAGTPDMHMDSPHGALPSELVLFPLNGVLMLPRGTMPLNVFEPRYLAMVDAALTGPRMIGIIQPAADGAVGLSAQTQVEAMQVLAGVMHVGQVEFMQASGEEYAAISNEAKLVRHATDEGRAHIVSQRDVFGEARYAEEKSGA